MKENQEDLAKTAKGAGISIVGGVAGKTFLFINQVLIARLLGAEALGIFAIGLATIRLAEIFARAGLHTGAMYFISVYRKTSPAKIKGILISSFSISLINGIVIGLALGVSAEFIASKIFHKHELKEIIKIFALSVPFIATVNVLGRASNGFLITKYWVLMRDIIQNVANITLVIVFLALGLKIKGLVYAYTLSFILSLVAGIYLISTRCFPDFWHKEIKPVYEVKRLLTYSLPLLTSGVLTFILQWINIFMLGTMTTSDDVGIYRAASQVPIFMTLFLQASNSIYSPLAANLFYSDQKSRLESLFKTTTRWIFFITLPITLIIILSAEEIMSIFGEKFVQAGVPVLVILAVAQLVNCVTGGVSFTLKMGGRQNLEVANCFSMVIMNIILNIYLIPRYGGLGAAISSGICIIGINLLRVTEVYILFNIHPYNMRYLNGIAAGLASTSIILSLHYFFNITSKPLTLLLNSLIISLLFLFFIIFNKNIYKRKHIITSLKSLIKGLPT